VNGHGAVALRDNGIPAYALHPVIGGTLVLHFHQYGVEAIVATRYVTWFYSVKLRIEVMSSVAILEADANFATAQINLKIYPVDDAER